MAKFEIELPNDVAEIIRAGTYGDQGDLLDRVIEALPVIRGQSHNYPRTPTSEDVVVLALLFTSLGRKLDGIAGNAFRPFVSVEERAKRSEKAKRSHQTRRRKLTESPADIAPRKWAPREETSEPAAPSNIVSLSNFRGDRQ